MVKSRKVLRLDRTVVVKRGRCRMKVATPTYFLLFRHDFGGTIIIVDLVMLPWDRD